MAKLKLDGTDKETPWISMPRAEEVFAEAEAIPDNLLLPLLRVDGGAIAADLEGIPICVIAHEVGIDEITFTIDDTGKYQITAYNDAEISNPQETRSLLLEYIDDNHDGPEGLEDENAELFEDPDERQFVAPSVDDFSSIEIDTETSQWLQGTDAPPSAQDGFVLALHSHPSLFGAYYVFYDKETRTIRQVFQCT